LALFLLLGGGLLAARSRADDAAADRAGIDFFEKKIRPVLAERCFRCHSAQAVKLKGNLRLDTRQGLRQGGNSGPAIVPGDAERSLLIKAIRQTDPELKMPPGQKLSAAEVADFEAWVRRGAPDPRTETGQQTGGASGSAAQWAFRSPQEPALPPVKLTSWMQRPIDRFILARLEERGLSPAPPVDKRALLRRATYDLTGLPPTPAEIDAFVADTRPDAFARVVDRLFASPRYGECWARHWLDLVRYTDDFDEAWRYRDWVVQAFNRDLPYDQFVRDQIAGDRVPASEPGAVNADGIVATTFLSIGQWGGIDRRKRMADIVDDQIDTVGRTFMGLTLACARCHDHKFDPLTTADYYGLAGIFYSTRVISDTVYLSHGTSRLQVPLVPAAAVEEHRRHMARVQQEEAKLQEAVERHYAAFARSLVPQTGRYLLAAWDYQHRPTADAKLTPKDWASGKGLRPFALDQWLHYLEGNRLSDFRLLNKPVAAYDGEAGVQAWMGSEERPWWGVNTTVREVPIETFVLPPRTVSMNPGDVGGTVGWRSPFTGRVRLTGRLTDADPHDGAGVHWAIDHVTAAGRHEVSSGDLPNGASYRLDQGRHPERLAAMAVKAGDEICLDVWLRQGDAHYDVTDVELTITRLDGPGRWDLTQDLRDNFLEANPHRDGQGHGNVWAFYDMAGSHRRQRMPAVEAVLAGWYKATAADKPDRGSLEQAAQDLQEAVTAAGPESPMVRELTDIQSPFWVHARDDTQYLSAEARADLARRAAEVEALKAAAPSLPCANGAQEGGTRFSLFPGCRDARIHVRGSYERLGKGVPRRFPAVLAGDHQPPITHGSGRWELARWLTQPDHPLTARVMVNRVWQHHFGEGIVRTPSNFGKQGEPPTHPELLDYLARRFVESGWSVKAMHRQIMLSAAYQQSTKATNPRADPDNRLVGRMNRRRLEAEPLHDGLLAICGCLDEHMGGPASDASTLRRMLYLRSSRLDRGGFRALFDGADASIHVDRRSISTIAPQALFLMNGPPIIDHVRRLISRPDVAKQARPEDRIRALYRLAYGRQPTDEEIAIGQRFIGSPMVESNGRSPTGQLGPWEAYAQALFVSNEFLFVD
jgi:hypothetical protein